MRTEHQVPPHLRTNSLGKPTPWVTLRQQVRDWLRQRAGLCFCDACIEASNAAARISSVTNRIASEEGFARYTGRCDSCGQKKSVIYASPNH
jgi:hypothetical protein